MAQAPVITVIGNLTADPVLRTSQSGKPWVTFTVANTPSSRNRSTGQWEDGETMYVDCKAWDAMAENIADSLSKGMQVIVQGRLTQRSYTPRDGGEKRRALDLAVDEIGPSLRFAKAQVQRTPRRDGGFGGGPSQASPAASDFSSGAFGASGGGMADDPWAAPGTSDFDQAPPF